MTEVCEAERNWRGKSSRRTRQTGFCGFDHAITGAIYFTFDNGKSCLAIVQIRVSPNQFKFFTLRFLSRKNLEKKLVLTNKIFFCNFNAIQFIACVLGENLPNQSSGVQIQRDICTRFGRYLYSTKCSWIIKVNI